jgi:copper(I)-binding protein
VTPSSRGMTLPLRIAVAMAFALVPLIAGCEAGENAPTLQWHQPTDGSSTAAGDITISNAFVLGAPLNQVLQPGQAAGLYLALTNTGGPDRLVSVSAPGTAGSVTLPGGSIAVPSQRAILLTGPTPTVVLKNLTRPISGGSAIKIILTFQNAGTVPLTVPVMPQAQYYSTFSPPPTASPSASPSPSGTAGKHHKKGSPSPTATPTPTPS